MSATDLGRLKAVLRDPAAEPIPDEVVRELLSVAVRLYAATAERAESRVPPFPDVEAPSATEVCVTVGAMIEAAGVDLFDLVAWQSFAPGGR